MKIIERNIEGLKIIEPSSFVDERGYFIESYNKKKYTELGIDNNFIQDNESMSSKGVLRGLHFQMPPYAQAKLVRCIKGEVLDVAVDLRKNSSSYGSYDSVILNDSNKRQFYIPRGFAHGFVVLSEYAIFAYKVDNLYSPEHEAGIIWNDPKLNIDWELCEKEVIISPKDLSLDIFDNLKSPFI